jgi:hypothetical protein
VLGSCASGCLPSEYAALIKESSRAGSLHGALPGNVANISMEISGDRLRLKFAFVQHRGTSLLLKRWTLDVIAPVGVSAEQPAVEARAPHAHRPPGQASANHQPASSRSQSSASLSIIHLPYHECSRHDRRHSIVR